MKGPNFNSNKWLPYIIILINYFKCLDFILISLLNSFIDSFKLATINFILAYGQNVYGITLIQTLMFSKKKKIVIYGTRNSKVLKL